MHKFVRSLITEWRRLKLSFDGATVIVAVSGGADSVSLLLALADLQKLNKFNLKFVVAHFNHGLRGAESRADAEFVRDLAEDLGLEFVVGKGRLAKSGNLEENARLARYGFLERTAKKQEATVVLTGHTMDDQAETVLFNFIRGSGPAGLAGMSKILPIRVLRGGKNVGRSSVLLARPLLSWARRRDTEAYCRQLGVGFRHDSMNDDTSFSRVRLRKELIPLLRTYNPQIVETLSRTSNIFAPRDEKALPEHLKLSEINELTQPERYAALRAWLEARRGTLRSVSLKHIEAMDRLVNSRKSGREVELPGRGKVIKRSGELVFEANKG
ncbi:MAG TPA: tRNA lysidine(34) synthetase TilS [Pyrinomonadaceae bacterium]|nr:tRNA lysidine(34) synthetase TilS [Pyrinomonadaceae bacterium]